MKKKGIIGAGLASILLLGVMVPAFASAQGMFGFGRMNTLNPQESATLATDRFAREAQLLGISVDDAKNYWAQGKSVREIATEKGISTDALQTKMQELRKTQMKAHLDTLVSQGVITRAQADQRLLTTQSLNARQKEKNGRGVHRGMGMMGMGS